MDIKKSLRMVGITISILLICFLLLGVVLLLYSPGKPAPFLDKNGNPLAGSISEKIHVRINGVDQGMFIMGKNMANPVLLYLHGGMPDYFLRQKYPTGLEDYFTVIWWEQRGSGLSFSADIGRSAHSPLFEEPEKMQRILKEDVLNGLNNLADIK